MSLQYHLPVTAIVQQPESPCTKGVIRPLAAKVDRIQGTGVGWTPELSAKRVGSGQPGHKAVPSGPRPLLIQAWLMIRQRGQPLILERQSLQEHRHAIH